MKISDKKRSTFQYSGDIIFKFKVTQLLIAYFQFEKIEIIWKVIETNYI